MKWLVMACVLAAGPAIGIAVRRRERVIAALVFALAFLVFFNTVSFTPGFAEDYRGTDRGFTISLVDCVAYVLYFAAPPALRPAPFRAVRYLYLAVCVGSVVVAPVPLYTAFTVWTMLRLYLMISALHRALEDRRLVPVVYQGLGWGIIYVLVVCGVQRYVHHQYQVTGTFDHQNSMGMAACLVAAVIFPVVLSGNGGRLAIGALASAGLVVLFSLSRGCLVILPLALGTIYMGSIAVKPSQRKQWIGLAGAVAALAVLAKSLDTILSRFATAPPRSAESRVIYEHMAARMLSDHPAGVGLNQFSFMAGEAGYYRIVDELDASWLQPNALVHNIYWLTLAELGLIGLVVYIALVGQPIVTALRGAWKHRASLRGHLLFGCFVGLAAFCLHGRLEWAARQERLLYLFWMVCAIAAALYRNTHNDAPSPAPVS